jgi:hypothetical protein
MINLFDLPADTTQSGFVIVASGIPTAIKANLAAVTDPTVNSDSSAGYAVGSLWINISLNKVFVCTDKTIGAAVWRSFIDPSLASNYSITTGTDTYAATLVPALQAYVNGLQVNLRFNAQNTGASTININGLGAKNIFKNGSALSAADIKAGMLAVLVYNSSDSRFDMVAGGSTSGSSTGVEPFLFIGN